MANPWSSSENVANEALIEFPEIADPPISNISIWGTIVETFPFLGLGRLHQGCQCTLKGLAHGSATDIHDMIVDEMIGVQIPTEEDWNDEGDFEATDEPGTDDAADDVVTGD